MREDRTDHFDALKSTALFWVLILAFVAIGALIRFSTTGSVDRVESQPTKTSVPIQRSVEPIVRQSNDERDDTSVSNKGQRPPAVREDHLERKENPAQRQDSSSLRPEGSIDTIANEPTLPTHEAASLQASASKEMQPIAEGPSRKS